tara:strand:- start:5027 stop:5749 length:723 start_codon:yes stop_codon:yes gene_type:complete
MLCLIAATLLIQTAQPAAGEDATPAQTETGTQAPAPLATDAASLIAEFDTAYETYGDLVAEVSARAARDRYIRTLLISRISRTDLEPDVRSALISETEDTFDAVDQDNTAWALGVLDDFDFARLNADMPDIARKIAGLIQHGDLAAQQRLLATVEPLALAGDFDGQSYALLYDRVAMGEGRPQRYGSQFQCVEGEQRPYELEAPEAVDERRAAFGLEPLAEYEARNRALYGASCASSESE